MHALVEQISAMPVALSGEEFDRLEARKVEEAEFHDRGRAVDSADNFEAASNARWYAATQPVQDRIAEWMHRTLPGAAFLDYACGAGGTSFRAARIGAACVIGIDISLVSIQNNNNRSVREGLRDRVVFLQRDCEATGLPAGTFDAALCSGMLHHLDLERAFPELARILKPGGRVLCCEPLDYNPVIRWYRRRTPELRTAWEAEHILTRDSLALASRWFDVTNVRFFCLTSPLATLAPQSIRRPALALTHAFDRVLLSMPGLRWWAWQVSFELVKKGAAAKGASRD